MSQSVRAGLAPDTADPDLPPAHVDAQQTFRATPDQVREARRFLARTLGESEVTEDAVLCLSELATNATRHSDSARPGGQFTVRAVLAAGCVHVEVEDDGGTWRQGGRANDGVGGRGLRIVAELADSWGTTRYEARGKRTVWFEISSPPRPPPASQHTRSYGVRVRAV
ncbi:MAG TPA: ATP-binding protein [Streptosporangiaceae bacterium]|nr:ATP-binding protein [Streptosporangiaceae bacterium]